jgi:hypothetical protein
LGFSRVFDDFIKKLIKVEPLSFNGFCNGDFGIGGFPLLGDKGMHSSPFDLGERFIALYKNLLGALKCEHTKRLGGFEQMGISIKVD